MEVADDATAEAFKRLCQHWSEVREPRPWLYRTAYRLVVEQLQRSRREGVLSVHDTGVEESEWPLSEDLASFLRRLSPDQRLAVFLVYYAGSQPTVV